MRTPRRPRVRPAPCARRVDRIPVDSLKLDGGRRLFDLLLAWDPDE
ncbi:hypothetical protein ACFCW6_33660 [Streptomyces sp. NPDC056333]